MTADKNKRSIRPIIGVFLILLALFLEFSLITHSTTDNPAWHYNADKPVGFSNWGGTVGNFFATNLFLVFGIVAYLLAAMVGLWGIFLIWRRQISVLPLKILCLIIFIAAALSLAGLVTPAGFNSGRMETLGGLTGAALAGFTIHTFGSIGSYLLALFVLGASIILATDWLAYDVGAKFGRIIYAMAARFIGFINALRQGIDRKHAQDKMIKQLTKSGVPAPVTTPMVSVEDGDFGSDQDEPGEDDDARISKIAETKPRVAPVREPAKAREVMVGNFKLPGLDLLEDPEAMPDSDNADEVKDRIVVIEGTLRNFGIEAKVVNIERGPVVTKYEIELAPGISVHKVAGMIDDLSIALKSPNVTVVAPIPGKSTVGIDVPNTYKGIVRLKELVTNNDFILPLCLGKDAAGTPVVRELDEMPHILIAGTTGSGKSICIDSGILSMLMKRTPDELKLLLIDPKMVELSAFKDIPHLISPVVTDMKRAPLILQWLVRTMDERYELLLRVGVKKISSYNQLTTDKIKERLSEEGEEPVDVPNKLPYIVVVIDELADLMMAASDDVENAITRLAQKSRAVGIHLILATQRPSVDVITGLIKSNMPARIAFKVASKVDSRTILDRNGAERLLGKGDMLFLPPSSTDLIRAQCTFVSDKEIHNIVDFLKKQGSPVYDTELLELESKRDFENLEDDELFEDAVRVVLETQRGSVSLIQRRLNIGYSRAARLIEMMAKVGIVGGYKNSKAREVIMNLADWENAKTTAGRQ
ncbi:MAG: DNA translocase FtsK [Planctomycetes bacterium]|nr:DNA translocase FtsK [Planctomycetota bacterium]